MNDLPGTLELLVERVDSLEKRVHQLEHPSQTIQSPAAQDAPAPADYATVEELSFAKAGGLFPVLGRAMLGIAGAYLLRAVAESTSLPRSALAAIAIVYAFGWLVWAVRSEAESWIPGLIYAGTSALILVPMVWELTLSFNVLSGRTAAAILCGYVSAVTALEWKQVRTTVVWVAYLSATAAALGLAVATRQLIPFVLALLFMAALCEASSMLNRPQGVRFLVIASADLAVWVMIFIYANPQIARTEYPAASVTALLVPCCALFLIGSAAVAVRCILQGLPVTAFLAVQAVIAFLLAAAGVLYFRPNGGGVALGLACLLLSLACAAVVFIIFRAPEAARNAQVFAAWATALLITGCLFTFPLLWSVIVLSFAAPAASIAGSRLNRVMLKIHGLLLLIAATIVAGLPEFVFRELAGVLPQRMSVTVGIAAISLLLCYFAAGPSNSANATEQMLRLVPAVIAGGVLVSIAIHFLFLLAAWNAMAAPHHLAFIRTFTTCTLALMLAFAGARSHRVELTRIAYATLIFIAAKLIFEDLRHGHLEFIAASIFLFAVTLIAVPRLARTGPKI